MSRRQKSAEDVLAVHLRLFDKSAGALMSSYDDTAILATHKADPRSNVLTGTGARHGNH